MSILTEAIESAASIAISGHIRPDGDCIGSSLSLYNYISDNYPEKKVSVFLETFSHKFRYLNGSEKIMHKDDGQDYDLFISVDVSVIDRLGEFGPIMKRAAKTFCVDHHVSNSGFADSDVIYPNASSTCEVIYQYLDSTKISENTATCLYTGIVHDTGVFKYSNTSPLTMRIAANLKESGIAKEPECINSYYDKRFEGLKIWGLIMERAELTFDNRLIYSYSTWKDQKEYGALTSDLDGVVSEMMNVEPAVCSVFLYQTGENTFKASLRSRGSFDVAKIAGEFGGGGHINASGCTLEGKREDCIDALIKCVGKYF